MHLNYHNYVPMKSLNFMSPSACGLTLPKTGPSRVLIASEELLFLISCVELQPNTSISRQGSFEICVGHILFSRGIESEINWLQSNEPFSALNLSKVLKLMAFSTPPDSKLLEQTYNAISKAG